MPKQVLQFKITLNDITPKIWRRIQVLDNYTFWDLHCAIQNAIGWANSHLHGYYMTSNKYGRARPIRIQMPHPEWNEHGDQDESKELLVDWFPKKLKQCIYTYDFGDNWDHTVLFEKKMPVEKSIKYPVCLDGKNSCPPEDCGGSWGYEHLLTVASRPQREDDSIDDIELRNWLGLEKNEKYDPTLFNCEEVIFDNPKIALKEYLRDQERYG